ncbi:uncharacterized protein LOC127877838 isoform X2 [Dreissena polymorpha]|nr:uncharacterized protein LOC127877838 isoform X2 [Dreissena polymorpha]
MASGHNRRTIIGRSSRTTQTDHYNMHDDQLIMLCQRLARVLDVYGGTETALFSSLRQLVGPILFNVNLVDLIGFEPGTFEFIGQQKRNRWPIDISQSIFNDKSTQTCSISYMMTETVADRWQPNRVVSSDESTPTSYSKSNEDYSFELSLLLTWLGYGSELRQARVDMYKKSDTQHTARSKSDALITAGSKGEGLSCVFESDRDTIFVLHMAIALEEGINLRTIPYDTTVFRMETDGVYPGHCKLLFQRLSHTLQDYIPKALCEDGRGRAILSSDLFVDISLPTERAPDEVRHKRAGPSSPCTLGVGLEMDRVPVLRCQCPSILKRWANRPRFWPSPEVVQKVVLMGAFVSPVGFKGSLTKNVEWRICFNEGENVLVSNLNDTQIKMYVLLKMIVKSVIKPLHKEITSYTLKNIVFWVAETNPQVLFDETSLLFWLHEGLGKLRTAITKKNLEYYMIPERNLMANCDLQNEQEKIWVSTITDIINEGPRLVLRLSKLRNAIVSYPEPLRWYCKRRTELEILNLAWLNRDPECRDERGVMNESDNVLKAIMIRQTAIVREIRETLFMEGIAVMKEDHEYLIHIRMLM